SNLADNNLGGYKWPGFFFGIGMSHQWPAVRLGGVAPVISRNIAIAYNLANVPAATQFRILMTSPSGAETIVPCTCSPCIFAADARQGAHIMRLQYLDANSKVLAESTQATTVEVQ